MTFTRKLFAAFTLITAFFNANASHAADAIYTTTFSNVAVGGYDTTSYYAGTEPIKGSKKFSTNWQGAEWYFANQENLEKFQADPAKYAPQYGGYCAWAIAHDKLVSGDPEVYHIENGKLYLNYDKKVAGFWLPRKDELIQEADGKYMGLIEGK